MDGWRGGSAGVPGSCRMGTQRWVLLLSRGRSLPLFFFPQWCCGRSCSAGTGPGHAGVQQCEEGLCARGWDSTEVFRYPPALELAAAGMEQGGTAVPRVPSRALHLGEDER